MPDLPDAAITDAAAAIHFWSTGDDRTCACLPGHPTARYDNDRERAIRALEAAAPALRAQGAATAYGGRDVKLAIEAARTTGRAEGAATERARIRALLNEHHENSDCDVAWLADLLDGDDG